MTVENRSESGESREQALVQQLLRAGYRPRLAERVAEARVADMRHIEGKRGRKEARRRGGEGMG